MGSCQRHLWPQSDLWPLWRKVLRDVGCKEMHPPFCSWHVRPCKLGITCQWCFGADLVWSHTFVHCYSLGEWSPDAQVTDNGYSAWAWLGFRQNGPRARKGRDAEASSKRCWSCWCAPWAAAKCSLGGLYSFLGYINMEPCPLLCPKAGRLSCPFVWVDFAHGEWGLVAVLKNRSHRGEAICRGYDHIILI